MEGLRLYTQLQIHPLFQGMERADLDEIITHTKFDFRKYNAQQVIAEEYSPCNHMLFLLSGTVTIETASDDRSYKMVEECAAPWLIPIDNLFGLRQHYTHTFKAKTTCHILAIDKGEVLTLAAGHLVFRMNLLNILSALSQKKEHILWRTFPKTLEERIARFLNQHCITPKGTKTLHIKMTRLAEELNDSRLDISRALNRMQEQGLIVLQRGRIQIPAIEKVR